MKLLEIEGHLDHFALSEMLNHFSHILPAINITMNIQDGQKTRSFQNSAHI